MIIAKELHYCMPVLFKVGIEVFNNIHQTITIVAVHRDYLLARSVSKVGVNSIGTNTVG